MTDRHPLDSPTRAALLGPHAHLAQRHGEVLSYPADVCLFVALPDEPAERDWRDAATLLGPGGVLGVAGMRGDPPAGWEVAFAGPGVQLVDENLRAEPDDEAVALGPADVPEMLSLVERTKPGPFLPRTIALGTYLGIRRGGKLVAMAGERLHPPGWTEISAVCTDAGYRGHGLATRLVRAVAAGIRARGETPFLHAAATNVGAIRLYTHIGFRLRRHTDFVGLRVPADAPWWRGQVQPGGSRPVDAETPPSQGRTVPVT